MKNPLLVVKQLLKELTSTQRAEILAALTSEHLVEEILGMLDVRPDACRCCKSTQFIKNGLETVSKRQRYRCKDCQRTFTAMTGTVLDNIQDKHKFIRYVRSFIENHSLRKAASIHNIALNTSFHWRHKLLSALGLSAGDVNLSQRIEADEKYIPFQQRDSLM